MNPNASDIVLVNSLIEIAAKGSALQMQMKDLFLLQTIVHILLFSDQIHV